MIDSGISNILVVLYNKSLRESKTLSSLLSFNISNSRICIVNNGPSMLDIGMFENETIYLALKKKFISIEIFNYIENRPLSLIYNTFISSDRGSSKFVLLDDDSELTDSFINIVNCHETDFDVELPRIISVVNNETYYPVEDGSVVRKNKVNLDVQKTISIGSGLILTHGLVRKFADAGEKPFDERFALYGVDYSLFRIMRRLNKRKRIPFLIKSESYINHSLSRVGGKLSDNTLNERLFDVILSARHYPSYETIYPFIKKIIKFSLKLKVGKLKESLEIFTKGVHPRCMPYYKK